MDQTAEQMPIWLEAELRCIVTLFVEQDFDGLEKLSGASRLTASEMKQSIVEYGRTLVVPPDLRSAGCGRIEVGEPSFWVTLPFLLAEEGRSDLEVRLTVYDPPDVGKPCRIEFDDILAP